MDLDVKIENLNCVFYIYYVHTKQILGLQLWDCFVISTWFYSLCKIMWEVVESYWDSWKNEDYVVLIFLKY